MTVPERFDLADGGSLALVRAGDPVAPATVLLLHSYAQDRRVWHKVLSLLPDVTSVAVVAYDHRGHGDSSPATAATATLEQLADDLAEVVERAIPHGPVVIVGHGMGGHVAMAMAARNRLLAEHRLGALLLLSTSVGWVAETLPRPLGRLVQDLHAILGPRLVDHVHRRIDKATTIGLRWLLLGDDPAEADVRLVAEMVSQHWPDTVAVFRPGPAPGALGVALEVVAGRPLIAMVGDKDRLVPVGRLDDTLHGHSVTVPGAGHMLPLEAAAGIVPRIAAQVREVLTPVNHSG
ncbi:alpha/beta fold hydrolase [Actinophytocola glycyrrhizae]|uniref:Alpha/beta fold hydrolase n=1 Tax=Actinophytocola glycyrrhizae TaxID=2044873 RepID=A0ABV9RU59_9PSEU